jgi:hypothetical protein
VQELRDPALGVRRLHADRLRRRSGQLRTC